jgi:hypothetical protein
LILLHSENVSASDPAVKFSPGIKDASLITKKRGVYIGYERGLYDVIQFGMEFQRKKTAIKESNTNAFCFGFGYNLKQNILGYDFSYWHKQGKVGLTYGVDFLMLTDFKKMNIGIAPVVGFRFSGFHLQTGYKFMSTKSNGVESNNFFIRLRFTIHKKTDRDFNWGRK